MGPHIPALSFCRMTAPRLAQPRACDTAVHGSTPSPPSPDGLADGEELSGKPRQVPASNLCLEHAISETIPAEKLDHCHCIESGGLFLPSRRTRPSWSLLYMSPIPRQGRFELQPAAAGIVPPAQAPHTSAISQR